MHRFVDRLVVEGPKLIPLRQHRDCVGVLRRFGGGVTDLDTVADRTAFALGEVTASIVEGAFDVREDLLSTYLGIVDRQVSLFVQQVVRDADRRRLPGVVRVLLERKPHRAILFPDMVLNMLLTRFCAKRDFW